MHIGNLIAAEITKNKFSIVEVAKELSKSETAVRKDLKKDKLHMDVVEGYSRVLKINLYSLLAKEMEGKNYEEPVTLPTAEEESRPPITKKVKSNLETMETVSLTFNISADKKASLLKLLTS